MSFLKYPKYKDSGIEWLGEVPEHWDVVALKRITNLKSGDSITGETIEETGDYPVLGGNGLRGYTGDSAIIPVGFGPSIAGFDMVLKCHSAQPDFIQFALLSIYLKEGQIDLEKMRAAQPHLNAEELSSCFLVLPHKDEQTEIVAYLNEQTARLDALTAEAERGIELLQERRTALISAAVTGKIDVRGITEMEPS